MNGRSFGDTRDLFKFDLVRHIMKSLPDLAGFTFVPMLTGSEKKTNRKKGAKKDLETAYKNGKAGSQNRELMEHLARLQEIDDDLEYFNGVSTYFDRETILIDIPGKQRFTAVDRDTYFKSVFHKFPKNALIFIDPESGLRGNGADDKHLLYSELRTISDRMDAGSILMIYQHLPKGEDGDFIPDATAQLEKTTGIVPVVITDNDAVFFILAKSAKLSARLKNVVECYADTYPALQCVSTA